MCQLDYPSIIDWVINYEIIKNQRGFLSVVISASKKYERCQIISFWKK